MALPLPPTHLETFVFFANINLFFLFLQGICLFQLSFTKQLDFFENNVKTGSNLEFWPKKYPFFTVLSQNVLDSFFVWLIFGEFFIFPGNMFIRTVFLRNNSIFLKKCKNCFKNGVLPQKIPPFFYIFLFFGFPNSDFTRRFSRRPHKYTCLSYQNFRH